MRYTPFQISRRLQVLSAIVHTFVAENEITAVPELLDLIDIEGTIVTADAMSCQKKIVSKIIEKKADYTIAVKENQPTLLHDIAD